MKVLVCACDSHGAWSRHPGSGGCLSILNIVSMFISRGAQVVVTSPFKCSPHPEYMEQFTQRGCTLLELGQISNLRWNKRACPVLSKSAAVPALLAPAFADVIRMFCAKSGMDLVFVRDAGADPTPSVNYTDMLIKCLSIPVWALHRTHTSDIQEALPFPHREAVLEVGPCSAICTPPVVWRRQLAPTPRKFPSCRLWRMVHLGSPHLFNLKALLTLVNVLPEWMELHVGFTRDGTMGKESQALVAQLDKSSQVKMYQGLNAAECVQLYDTCHVGVRLMSDYTTPWEGCAFCDVRKTISTKVVDMASRALPLLLDPLPIHL